ncbi:MAG: hypothetical protein Kow0065_18760 [Methylomicrobium sp.]
MSIALLGVICLVVSVLGSVLLVGKRAHDEKPVRILFFMVYFWLLLFVQLTVLALVDYFGKKYGVDVIVLSALDFAKMNLPIG